MHNFECNWKHFSGGSYTPTHPFYHVAASNFNSACSIQSYWIPWMNTLVYLLRVVKTINIYLHTMFDISNNTIRPTILIIYAYSLTPAVVLSMLFMLTLNIVIVCGLFEQGFFLSFVIQYYRYRFNYQEGCWDHINRFNPTTFVYLSQARTWVSSVKCDDFVVVYVQWVKVRDECSFCWYWLSYWPPLFKLSFHNNTKIPHRSMLAVES